MDTVRKQNTPICKRGKVSADIVTDSANKNSEFADADCRPFANYDPQSADNIEPFANYDPQSADNIDYIIICRPHSYLQTTTVPFANYDTEYLQTEQIYLQTTTMPFANYET